MYVCSGLGLSVSDSTQNDDLLLYLKFPFFSQFAGTHQFDVAHAPEAHGSGERAWRVFGHVHALVAQHHVHVRLLLPPPDAVRHHHARLGRADPLVHSSLRVPLQKRVQLDVPAREERPGAGPSHHSRYLRSHEPRGGDAHLRSPSGGKVLLALGGGGLTEGEEHLGRSNTLRSDWSARRRGALTLIGQEIMSYFII